MKRLGISLVMVLTFAAVCIGGQGQAAPAPAAPSKVVELAQAATPAQGTGYPIPGKVVSVIVPYEAGGGTSVAAMRMSALLEKILGTPFQVIHRPGAGGQIGFTELARSKPDGYTLCYGSFGFMIVAYLDPDRKAVFTRKSFQPVATHFTTTFVIGVPVTSPYKTLKDLIDAAKAEPGKIKMGITGLMGPPHMVALMLEKAAGVKFTIVNFNGDAPAANALLGGHVDATPHAMTGIYSHIKSGAVRPLAVSDSMESEFLPGVKTLQSLGYDVEMVGVLAIHAPAGTPPGVVAILSEAVKKAMSDEEHKKQMRDLGFELRYMDPEQTSAAWAKMESRMAPLLQQFRNQ